MSWVRTFLAQPFVHFLLLGGLIFAAAEWRERTVANAAYEIEISESTTARLATLWEAKYARAPTAQEMDLILDDYIKEEIFYREALKLGLDSDDIIIRRRLAQKYAFLAEDLAPIETPSAETLRAWYDENPDPYLRPARVSFSHIYFSREASGEGQELEGALEILADLSAGTIDPDTWRELGDGFMLKRQYAAQSLRQIADVFGAEFAVTLFNVEVTNTWTGPVVSVYGVHLVRISRSEQSHMPTFEKVEAQVLKDFEAAQRLRADEAHYADLRARYQISTPISDASAP